MSFDKIFDLTARVYFYYYYYSNNIFCHVCLLEVPLGSITDVHSIRYNSSPTARYLFCPLPPGRFVIFFFFCGLFDSCELRRSAQRLLERLLEYMVVLNNA